MGYTHVFTGALEGTPGSGEDAQIVHLGLSLPLWFHQNTARVRRARELERAATLGRQDARTRLRTRLARVWFRVGNTRRLVRLYEEVLVPRAERAARTSEELLAAGKGSLAGTVETVAVLHNFRLAGARARADLGRAVAELEALLGRALHGGREELE